MISDIRFKELLNMRKYFADDSPIVLPNKGTNLTRIIKSYLQNEIFILDVDRGKINVSKIKYQAREKHTNTILLRIDLNGPRHMNPDGIYVPFPHIHIYKDGFGDKWAYPLDTKKFSDVNDFSLLLKDFLIYFNIDKIPLIVYNQSLL